MRTRSLLGGLALLASPLSADTPSNAVVDWSRIVQPAIHSAGAPRPAGSAEVLHTMVVLAMYDAVVAIEGGYRPYAAAIDARPGADARAAVATAAYLTARSRVAQSQRTYLDEQYAAYLAAIPATPPRARGVAVGEAAAAAILAARANDGMSQVVPYQCSSVPPPAGEFTPDSGCPSGPGDPQPVDAKLGRVLPFTFGDPARYRPDGPDALESEAYAADFVETRDYGRADSAVRSQEETDIAWFWAEHPYVHWNRNLIALAVARGLGLRETARFFALVHTAAADATIAGFEAKYHYRTWRPRTAIPLADLDGNAATEADPAWAPLLKVNHPEYPSGHGFWSGALLAAVRAYFGTDRVDWTLTTSRDAVPQLVQAERTYARLSTLDREIADARVWAGLHWRHSMDDGAEIGRRVAAHVVRNFFRPAR